MTNFGLIGVGAIAQAYINALENCEFARMAAVADVRPDVAAAAAESTGSRGFTIYRELADWGGCDAVIICTPPVTHSEIARHFLELGIPVLCEKPLATSLAAARELVALADRRGVLLSVASKFRYVDAVIKAKSMIASGLIGDILLLENTFAAPVDMTRRWNADPAVSGGGVVIDNGTHSADLVRFLLGPVSSVNMIVGPGCQDIPVEDNALLLLETEGGAMARVDLSWCFDKESPYYLGIYGTGGCIQVGWKDSKFKQRNKSDWMAFGQGYNKLEAFRNQLTDFCGAISGPKSALVTSEDALATVRVIESAYRSAEVGNWIGVGTVEPLPAAAPERFWSVGAAE